METSKRSCCVMSVWEVVEMAVREGRMLKGLSEECKRKIFTED